ncbi:iron-sulfur cluster carrier protein MrpORP [Desulfosoma caldarium]|uniref:Iron-sulfur cluster carrier protein n=1 Tax=Desulfosoma caldarium TaxID=610254 RepID=A0A3N1UUN1_9BACT|nr:iron-sulfur cluster carrier protein MrpORP [Desulfosoma caldarium]ROQ93388.1 Mrp family chromosome partitioning ATPase [Desulfosoma caldarium]
MAHSCQHGDSACSGGKAHADKDEDRLVHEQLRRIGHKLLVMSGKGGVGKSSVAAGLAIALAQRGFRVGLLDVDLHGPSIPKILGVQGSFHVDDQKRLVPHALTENLHVVSIQLLLDNPDAAVIWRGPVKHGVIKQFIAEVHWGDLDYLIVDCPPGTGDEPLSIAQTIPDVHAVVVTTPQEIALQDVRKSINFCRRAHVPILGLVENMSALVCPHCGKEVPLFGAGGGRKTAERMHVHFLGNLPFDLRVVEAGDAGTTLGLVQSENGSYANALNALTAEVIQRCSPPADFQDQEIRREESEEKTAMEPNVLRIAVPTAEGRLCNHFGHCEKFVLIDVRGSEIQNRTEVTPPPHEPGLLPRWLADHGVGMVIAGGMGRRAIGLFEERGIRVLTGAPTDDPQNLVRRYLEGTLECGANVCDH